jgi:hypothetical protein
MNIYMARIVASGAAHTLYISIAVLVHAHLQLMDPNQGPASVVICLLSYMLGQ